MASPPSPRPASGPSEPSASPVLVYDPVCGLCAGATAWLVDRGFLVPAGRRPFPSYAGAERDRLLAAGIRNEILALDPVTGEVEAGVQGILSAIRAGPRPRLARVLDRPLLRPLLSALYRLVSYNRRILAPAPPDRRLACACDPEPHALWRSLFGAGALAVAGVSAAALGHLAFPAVLLGDGRSGLLAGVLATAIAWAPPLAVARLGGGDGGERAGHVAWTAVTFGLWLLPLQALLLALGPHLEPGDLGTLLLGGLAGAFAVVFRRARRRGRLLGWPALAVPLGAAWVAAGIAAGVLLAA